MVIAASATLAAGVAAAGRSEPAASQPAATVGGEPPRLVLRVIPRIVRVARRTRFTLLASVHREGRHQPLPGALVRFAGRRVVTNRLGRATVVVTFSRPRFARAVASRPGLGSAGARVEVLGRLPRLGEEERPCFSGRYRVKNLSDPLVHTIDPRPISVPLSHLWLRRPPRALGFYTPRMKGIERHVYRLRVRLVRMQMQPDLDIHLVVAEPGRRYRTMITEFPSGRCATVAISPYRNQMVSARIALLRACGRIGRRPRRVVGTATVTGVGFWDRRHGQFGVARNGVELHPVLGFRAVSCRTARAVPRRR